jgi:saccharopine dehydrogenase-like NADP-dependent oxidoreductase
VEVGVNGLDLSSDDPQFALHDEAVKKDMIFIPGVGATPGITNMMVRRAGEVLDRLDEVEIYFAAFRCLAPAPGLLETTLWEFKPGSDEREEVYFEGGQWHSTPPLSGEVPIQFHEHIGVQTVYYVPHDEAYSLPISYPSLSRAAVRGCFPPHVMRVMGALLEAKLLTDQQFAFNGSYLPAIEVIRKLLLNNPFSKENPVWGYGLVVEVLGVRKGRRVKCTYQNHHPPQEDWGGESAYFKNVGIPLSIGAQLIATGQATSKGVCPPEIALPTAPFFDALAKRGITIQETIHEEGSLTQA